MQASVNKSTSTTVTVRFPDEIVFYILLFLNPSEVIQLRLVSRQFNHVTRDARLWRTFYTNSHFIRPSGPFLWQSPQFLERILIHSARISQTWTSQPTGVVSHFRGPRIPLQRSPVSTSFDFLFGRLFIWREGEHLLAQDLETGVGRLLWESTEPISSLSACSLTFPDSERIFIALRHVDEPFNKRTPIKLLEFPLQDDVRLMLGPMTFEMDMPECANFPLSAGAPFLYFDGGTDRLFAHVYERLVVDVRTWIIYKFPVFSTDIDTVLAIPHREITLLSGRHVLVFHPEELSNPPRTLIQAFVAPDPPTGQLCLTHEVLTDFTYMPVCCLRGAIVDPSTGGVNIRFLVCDNPNETQTHFLCIDLAIPPRKAASAKIPPMLVNTVQELLVLSGHYKTVFFDASDDGHGRGIITLTLSDSPEPWSRSDTRSLYKFSIDASGERCTAMISQASELPWQDGTRNLQYFIFDGMRGRICRGVAANYECLDLMVLSLH